MVFTVKLNFIDGWFEENVACVETGIKKLEDTYKGETVLESSLGARYL